jgi:hypothetical protein
MTNLIVVTTKKIETKSGTEITKSTENCFTISKDKGTKSKDKSLKVYNK